MPYDRDMGHLLAAFAAISIGAANTGPVPPHTLAPITWSLGGNDYCTVTVEFREEYSGPVPVEYCVARCEGGKHFRHKDCDDSCDKPCRSNHSYESGWRLGLGIPLRFYKTDIDKAFEQFGSLVSPVVSIDVRLDELFDKYEAGPRSRRRVGGHRPNQNPCEWGNLKTTVTRFDVVTTTKFFRIVNVNGQDVRTEGPTAVVGVGNIAHYGEDISWSTEVQCRCELVVKEEKEEVGALMAPPPAVCVKTPTGLAPMPTSLEQQIGFTATCSSMSNCSFTAENPSSEPMEICVMPGTILESQDPKIQNEVVCSQINMILPARNLFASILGFDSSSEPVKADGIARCLNIGRKAPDSSTKFKWKAGDIFTQALANFETKQMRRGPHDQVRMWLHTDAPTLEEIQKILIPAPSGGMYVREAVNMFRETRQDPADPRFKNVLDPSHLDSVAGSPENVTAYVHTLSRLKESECVNWLKNLGNNLRELIVDEREVAKEHLSALIGGFASCGSEKVAGALFTALEKSVTSEQLKKMAAAKALDGVFFALTREDTARAEVALRIAAHGVESSAVFGCLNVNAKLPEEVRAKCKAIAAQFGPKP